MSRPYIRACLWGVLLSALLLPPHGEAAKPADQRARTAKMERERNRQRLWRQSALSAGIAATAASAHSLSLRQKKQRQATLALLRRGIIPGDTGLGWAPLSTDELLRETGSPQLLSALEKVLDTLDAQIGRPYRWGGQTPGQGFDCSGLVWFAFRDSVNWPIPRTARALFTDTRMATVFTTELRRGDLVFFYIHRRDVPDHVGVYLGNHQFIEAPRTGLSIRISQLDQPFWQQHYAGARRVLTERNLRH